MVEAIVVGGGGHAKATISVLKKCDDYKILGYTDIEDRGEILGIKYLGNDSVLKEVRREHLSPSAVIGVGMIKSPDAQKRKYLFDLLTSLGFELPSVISPDAVINEKVEIKRGTVVMDGVVINSDSLIGEGVILNTGCSVDHDCKVGGFTHLAPGATLPGGVKVGDNVLIGAGATVIEYTTIGDNVLIGAGSVVTKDITEPGIYVGNPARLRP